MDRTAAVPVRPEWTLADFLGSYRFWALFLSSSLVAASEQSLRTMLPSIANAAGSTYQAISLFYFGGTSGWLIGAFLAFFVGSRKPFPALVCPAIVCLLVAGSLLATLDLFASPLFLLLFGLTSGTVLTVFSLVTVIALIGGRPGRIDFACLFTLMSTPLIAVAFAPMVASWFFEIGGSALIVIAFMLCLVLAMLLLLPAGRLSFEEGPRLRHSPLAPRRRSPILVALVLLAAQIVTVISALICYLFVTDFLDLGSPIIFMLSPGILCLSLAGIVYFARWVYRIHGELAGAQASARLLSPRAALLTALFIPLGLPILLMTLADLLNDRAAARGQARPVSLVWLGIWSFCLPPIAIALIQHGANKSYIGADGG